MYIPRGVFVIVADSRLSLTGVSLKDWRCLSLLGVYRVEGRRVLLPLYGWS